MAENIFEILQSEQPQVAAVLNTNEDVSDFLYAAYCHILIIAQDTPKDPKNLICLVSIENDRLLKVQLSYYEHGHNSGKVGTKLPSQRNLNLVNLLKVNPSVKGLAQRVVEILDRWVNSNPATKNQGFKNIKCHNSMLWKASNVITSELMVKYQFDEFVKTKMKWDVDENESVVEETSA